MPRGESSRPGHRRAAHALAHRRRPRHARRHPGHEPRPHARRPRRRSLRAAAGRRVPRGRGPAASSTSGGRARARAAAWPPRPPQAPAGHRRLRRRPAHDAQRGRAPLPPTCARPRHPHPANECLGGRLRGRLPLARRPASSSRWTARRRTNQPRLPRGPPPRPRRSPVHGFQVLRVTWRDLADDGRLAGETRRSTRPGAPDGAASFNGRARVPRQPRLPGPSPTSRRPRAGLAEGLERRRPLPDPARRHRLGQDVHDGLHDRAGPAAGARDRAQQDARRAALQRVPRVLPAQRGRVLRLLLRLLPARGLRPGAGHLHREGLLDQRGDRPPAARRHQRAVRAPRRDHRGQRLLHLRPRLAGEVRRAGACC